MTKQKRLTCPFCGWKFNPDRAVKFSSPPKHAEHLIDKRYCCYECLEDHLNDVRRFG